MVITQRDTATSQPPGVAVNHSGLWSLRPRFESGGGYLSAFGSPLSDSKALQDARCAPILGVLEFPTDIGNHLFGFISNDSLLDAPQHN